MQSRINRHNVHLRIFAHDDTDTLEDVLRTLGRAALRAEDRINDVAKTHDGEYLAEVVAEETMIVNDLLGCAFVAAQAYVTRVVSRTERLHQRVKRDGHDLGTTNATKKGIIKAFSNYVPNTTYSEIQLVNAFANYFKHHDEWPPNWDNATRQSEETVRIIRSVGALETSSDNCRKGLAALGIDGVFRVFDLAEILRRWHANLADAYRQELRPLGQS